MNNEWFLSSHDSSEFDLNWSRKKIASHFAVRTRGIVRCLCLPIGGAISISNHGNKSNIYCVIKKQEDLHESSILDNV